MAEQLKAFLGLTPRPSLDARLNHYTADTSKRETDMNNKAQQLDALGRAAYQRGDKELARKYATQLAHIQKHRRITTVSSQALETSQMTLASARMLKETHSLTKDVLRETRQIRMPSAEETQQVCSQLESIGQTIDETAHEFDDYLDAGVTEDDTVNGIIDRYDTASVLAAQFDLASIGTANTSSMTVPSEAHSKQAADSIPVTEFGDIPSPPSSKPSSSSSSSSPLLSASSQTATSPTVLSSQVPTIIVPSTHTTTVGANDFFADLGITFH